MNDGMNDGMNDEPIEGEVVEGSLKVIEKQSLVASAPHAITPKELKTEIDLQKAVKQATLTATDPPDWQLLGGKPYLQATGLSKIRKIFGLSYGVLDSDGRFVPRAPTCEQITREDGETTFLWTGWLTATALGISIFHEGDRSTDDGFFAGQKVKHGKVDLMDVRKAAKSNWEGRGFAKLLGLENLPLDFVKGAGVVDESTAAVTYHGKKTNLSDKDKEKIEEIKKIALRICEGDKSDANALLRQLTAFTGKDGTPIPGLTFEKLGSASPGRIAIAYKALAEEYKKREVQVSAKGDEFADIEDLDLGGSE